MRRSREYQIVATASVLRAQSLWKMTGGYTLLLQSTGGYQEPDHDGNDSLLRYNDMVDVMTGDKCAVVCVMAMPAALKFLLPTNEFALFHITGKIKDGSSTAYLAEKVYKPISDLSVEDARSMFASEVSSSVGIVRLRRTLKRERSHLHPECEQEVIGAVFSLDSPTKRMCSMLGSPPALQSHDK